MRRISDLVRKFRIRANGGIGKAPRMKQLKGRVIKGKRSGR
jgi:hypothetical protein